MAKSQAVIHYRTILNRTLAAVAAGTIAAIVCYYFVDRPVAYFVYAENFAQYRVLKWLTYPPPIVQTWSPLFIALLAIRLAWGAWHGWQRALFIACISLVVADQFRYTIGDAAGRYWPETWHNDNPSLIGNGTYGFHPFHTADDEGSFPSGHAARIAGFLSVFWLLIPRGRWLYVFMALPMLTALVAMNYHFVGDVIAGSVLGAIVGAWATALSDVGVAADANAVR
jgi:membrane-associated phospholipid phosphatase